MKCVSVRYPLETKGWKVFYLETREIFTRTDVIFYENLFSFKNLGKRMDTVDCHNRLVDDRLEIEEVWPSHEGAEKLGHANTVAQFEDKGRSTRESLR